MRMVGMGKASRGSKQERRRKQDGQSRFFYRVSHFFHEKHLFKF